MVDRINSHIQQYNYNTIQRVKNVAMPSNDVQMSVAPSFTAAKTVPFATGQTQNLNLRTTLSGKEETQKYTFLTSKLDKNNSEYYRVRLSKNGVVKTYRVNRLIALTFINNPLNIYGQKVNGGAGRSVVSGFGLMK